MTTIHATTVWEGIANLVGESTEQAFEGIVRAFPSCADCGEPVTMGVCLNLGTCETAHADASRLSRGETIKSRTAPAAWRGSGAID